MDAQATSERLGERALTDRDEDRGPPIDRPMIIIHDPAPDLAMEIELCWSVASEGGSGRTYYEILPDSSMNLIFRFSPSGHRLVLIGPSTESALVEVDEGSDYFCLRFRPGQTPRLVDVDPASLVNGVADLTHLSGEPLGVLAKRMLSARDPVSRQSIMEDLVRPLPPLIREDRCRLAVRHMDDRDGKVRVAEIASEIGMHVRSLQRLFTDQVGLSPKQLASLIRLRRLASELRPDACGKLTGLAYDFGYADQSHMIKDFKRLTGRLPGEAGAGSVRRILGAPKPPVGHLYGVDTR